MSLDVSINKYQLSEVFTANITHNLNVMADHAGVYKYLWRPDELGITKAYQLIPHLEKGLRELQENPEKYKEYDSPNGWGKYENLILFVMNYLEACKLNPEGIIEVSR